MSSDIIILSLLCKITVTDKFISLIIFQEGAFTNAVEESKLFLDESDGEFLSSWLLSE